MQLKERLKLVYDMIPECDVLSDIGTDHALLPAYALLSGRCRKAVACDVRKGPLESAENTVKQLSLEGKMELRLGYGLEPLMDEEADTIVIAGMGGELIAQILHNSLETARKAKNIILQPMTKQRDLRVYLWQQGFEILDEALAKEGEKLYLVLKMRYTGNVRKTWEPVNEIVGEKLIGKKDPLLPEWIEREIEKQEKILMGLKTAKNPDTASLKSASELLDALTELRNKLAGRDC